MNADGKVSMRELRAALAIIDGSIEFTDSELTTALKIADYDGSGSVDASEFMRAFSPHPLVKEEVQDGLHNMGRTADGRKMAYLSLNVGSCNINDVAILRQFVHLRHLDVSSNMLVDLSPLGCLPHLLTLNASNNMLTMVLDFKPPLCLREADFSNNRITAMNPLEQHRLLEALDLSRNRLRQISGVRHNIALRRLTLDNNDITEISNLGQLPLRHLSLANNYLSAVNGYRQLAPADLELMGAFEETFEEMEIAFQALDANQDGCLSAAEFKEGLKMIGIKVSAPECDKVIRMLDKTGTGNISANEFLGHFRRMKPHPGGEPGIRELADLQSINLSQNPIDSLEGMEGHPCLRKIDMSKTGVCKLEDVAYLKDLPLLQDLNLSDTPLFEKSASLAESSCMRLKVLYRLGRPQGKCPVDTLNQQLVSAEEMVSAANFHDPKHAQYGDRKRDDAQDLPLALFL